MESENPDDRQRIAAAEEQKKRKRAESNKKYYQKIKKESKQAQLKTIQNECSRCKAQLESYEKSVMKPLLDEACKFRKLVLEPGESSGHAIEAFEKQTDLVNSLSWELLKMESKQAQLKNVQNECSRCKAQLESYEKSVMKPLLDEACKFRKLVLEPGESSGHAIEAFEKQTALVNSLSWELLKMPPPGGGTCGGTSASTDKDAYPPLELSVIAMKSNGSVTTESFKPCQSLPEEWNQLEILKEELKWAQDRPYSNLFEDKEPPTL